MSHIQLGIRPFQIADKEAVIELWREVFPNEPAWNEPDAVIHRRLAFERQPFLVAAQGNAIVGTVLAGYDGVRGWIYHLAVASSVRRAGIASRLMVAAEDQLVALGCPKVNLQVRAANADVVAFYKAIGYEIDDRISMSKRLAASEEMVPGVESHGS
jgi:ribosomal protein S18 acetylase RimI-like enzyme